MLKNVPRCLSPEILAALCAAGHESKIVLCDGNCDITMVGKPNAKRLRADGISGPEMLEAVLKMIHLDVDCDDPIRVNEPGEGKPTPACYKEYDRVVKESDELPRIKYGGIHYMGEEFWDDADDADVVIATGERSLFGNVLLVKGVFYPEEN